jgi:hypothetical protein
MAKGSPKVLLVGESKASLFHLGQQMQKRGCDCWYACTPEKSVILSAEHSFQLVLSTTPLCTERGLLAWLGQEECNVFCCYPVRDSCWWFPVVRNGKRCVGSAALRPPEFGRMLDEMLREAGTVGSRGAAAKA